MFKVLLKARLMSAFSSFIQGSKTGRRKKRMSFARTVALFLLIFFGLSSSFSTIFVAIYKPLYEAGLVWVYFSFAFMFSFLLSVVGSVFMTQSQLYEAKDNDLLLSMPIPPKYILASRMMAILFFNLFYSLVIFVPAALIWIINGNISVIAFVFYIIAVLLTPLITTTVSCLLGWIVAFVSSKVKIKTIISLVFAFTFFALYLYLYFSMNSFINKIIVDSTRYANKFGKIYPLYLFGKAVADKDIISLLIFAAIAIIPFALLCYLLAKTFINIATANRGNLKIKYKERELKVSSPLKALVKKESTRFLKTPMYIFNCYIGALMLVLFGAFLLIKQDLIKGFSQEIPQFSTYAPAIYVSGICLFLSMTSISAPSISLEGKTLWLCQSLPVNAGKILCAKAYSHIILCLPPVIFASICGIIVFDMTALQMLFTIITPIVVLIFFAFLGVLLNLLFPKFNWINEIVAIKQSMSVLLYMLLAMVTIIVPFILYFTVFIGIFKPEYYVLIYSALLLCFSYFMYHYLNNGGARKFERLQ